jgi:hypothetical protein
MNTIKNEIHFDEFFIKSYKNYTSIVEQLYTKTITRANDKNFAHKYFLQQVESEIEFQQGFPFNGSVVSYFQIFYKMGFSWESFLKEVRILQQVYSSNNNNLDIKNFANQFLQFTPQELNRIHIENKIYFNNKTENSVYDFVTCFLLAKNRDTDFIKYVAKYKAMCDCLDPLRNKKEINVENNKNSIRTSNEIMRWNGAKGKKIELIRLLIALHDAKYFETCDGMLPSQEQTMNYFGKMLSVNLNNYEQDLSNGFESKLATNTAIFDKLKSTIEKRFHQKVEQH